MSNYNIIDPITYIERIYAIYGFSQEDTLNEIVNYMEESEQFKEWEICEFVY